MKSIKIILIIILLIMGISMIGGLIYGINNNSKEESSMETGFILKTKLANRKTFSTDEINKIKANYKFEGIEICESDTDEVILEEYMNRWDESMLARITQKDGVLSISGGERDLINILNPLRVKIKLYLPSTYLGALDMRCSSGSIKTDINLTLAELKLQASSGSIRTEFDDHLSFNKRGNIAEGTIGNNPIHTINLTASSGSIKIIN